MEDVEKGSFILNTEVTSSVVRIYILQLYDVLVLNISLQDLVKKIKYKIKKGRYNFTI